jgi:haloalkane dehalogenase
MPPPNLDWPRLLSPRTWRTLIVNGCTMASMNPGGPATRPFLSLHGTPTWGFLYRNFIAPLIEAEYQAIVPDGVGSGFSDPPRVEAVLPLPHRITDLVSLMDQLQLRSFIIGGHDWGDPPGVWGALQGGALAWNFRHDC